MAYRVSGPKAVVLVGGAYMHMSHGCVLPDGSDTAHIEHLLGIGLIEAVPEPDGSIEGEGEAPDGSTTRGRK